MTAFEIVLALSGRGQILFREVYPHHLSRAVVGGGKAVAPLPAADVQHPLPP